MKFDVSKESDPPIVKLVGSLEDSAREVLDQVREVVSGDRVELDCSGIQWINSIGAGIWMAFLEDLTKAKDVTISRCSVTFIGYCNTFRGFVGKAKIASFNVPLYCKACDSTMTLLVSASEATTEGRLIGHQCKKCSGPTVPETDLEIYLGFLDVG